MSDLKRLSVQQHGMLVGLMKDYGSVLTEWEFNLITTILHFKKMSPKQAKIVKEIFSSL